MIRRKPFGKFERKNQYMKGTFASKNSKSHTYKYFLCAFGFRLIIQACIRFLYDGFIINVQYG